MSLKQEIETWVAALELYDNNQYEEAFEKFDPIMETSKILFNCGVIQATLGEHEKAVELYQRAISLDQYLAVAYFQQGVSNFLLGDFEESLANFNDTLLYLRGNNMIDYSQLGLNFKLYSCEALFNRGLCYIYLKEKDAGMKDLSFAVKEKVVEDHNVIDEAILEEADGYTVFSIPVGTLYRPNQSKVKNLKTKDYLGKAQLIAASDRSDAFTGFTGYEIKNVAKKNKDDRPSENLSYAATNLVKPGLSSKRPDSGNMFPPTPPPETEKGASLAVSVSNGVNRGASVKNGLRPMPSRINSERSRNNDRDDQSSSKIQRSRTTTENRNNPSRQQFGREQQMAPKSSIVNEDINPDDLYDMYSNTSRKESTRSYGRQQRMSGPYNEEDENYSDYDGDSFDEGDFEMLPVRGLRRSQTMSTSGSQRRQSKRVEVRKIRIKAHCEDVRYIMVDADLFYMDLVNRIQEKFNLSKSFKIKVREDSEGGDMITLGDQDDLDMLIMTSKAMARKERSEVGKMEIWVM
ncbi:Neutrophil cytosol factor 2 [Golovinomyces cichoracearum]|uniref:Neutrophil cytosol factor 2 n=1 Tax=Golovinomyces cichoracearum TaxID=62708 RepID=A0A420IWK1_9PEZI|nr:Neutrophil cytosol factor 2 [Golovinomyces cichoracearum]